MVMVFHQLAPVVHVLQLQNMRPNLFFFVRIELIVPLILPTFLGHLLPKESKSTIEI